MNVLKLLTNWLTNLYSEFGADVPNPDKASSIINVASDMIGGNLSKFLGMGDNGIAFLADNGTVVKFTIDHDEAALWGSLANNHIPGIAKALKSFRLSDKKAGDTMVYMVNVEYVPDKLDNQTAAKISDGMKEAFSRSKEKYSQAIQKYGLEKAKSYYNKIRTVDIVRAFDDLADTDKKFEDIPEALITLADKHGTYLFDLTPQNFMMSSDGKVVLIDPSLPKLPSGHSVPKDLTFEQRLRVAMFTEALYYENNSCN